MDRNSLNHHILTGSAACLTVSAMCTRAVFQVVKELRHEADLSSQVLRLRLFGAVSHPQRHIDIVVLNLA
jgi:hypothetical protein